MQQQGLWLHAMRRYFAVIAGGNLVWEFAQLPLYTLWWEGTPGQILFATLHCTGGDLMIAGASFLGALLLFGSRKWPNEGYVLVGSFAVLTGLGYTVFSEWLNTEIRGSWAYTDLMPTLPGIGAGLAPLAQWIVVPLAALWWAQRPLKASNNSR